MGNGEYDLGEPFIDCIDSFSCIRFFQDLNTRFSDFSCIHFLVNNFHLLFFDPTLRDKLKTNVFNC